ncbi:MAG TPA: tol-pal system protein YbgF [Polyangiaceae bacterium]
MRVACRSVAAWVLVSGLSAAPACSHRNPADRSADQLKSEIANLQADRDRIDERLGALEAAEQQRESGGKPGSRSRAAASEAAPRLPVVRVGDDKNAAPLPPTDGEAPDIETGTADPRPVVQASGLHSVSDKRGRAGSRLASSASSAEAKHDYDAALSLVRAKQYEKALDALTGFLVRYPDHPYVENAMYWRGECFYAKGEYARAAEQFEGLIARFSYGNKMPDALLKLGLCQQRLGSQAQAEKTFAELKDRYPKSEAVRQLPRQ